MKQKLKKLGSKEIIKQFAKYFVTGIGGFVVDTLVLLFIVQILGLGQGIKIFGLIYSAKIVSGVFGSIFVFFINRQWSFKATEGKMRNQALRMTLVFVMNIFVGAFIYSLYYDLKRILGIDLSEAALSTIANLFTAGTQMLINFFIYKYIVYIKK